MDNLKPENTPYMGNILIVDDTPDNLRLLSNILTENGYKVRKAINGNLAIEAATLSLPDLILLDIMMPEMDGYEVCQHLKDNPHTRPIPVIFLTAKDEILDKLRGFSVGGVDYITKPYHIPEVLIRVATHLQISRLQKELHQQNLKLQTEIDNRITAEAALKQLNANLEQIVDFRTQQLQQQNQQLISLQNQLQQALATEQSLSKLKYELLSTISHQFRTPLTVISSSAALIQRRLSKGLLEGYDTLITRIDDSVYRITQMVEDVVFLAKANSQDITFEPENIALNKFCQTLVQNYPLPANSPHQINFIPETNTPDNFFADATLLKKMLDHLLQNAIRYSPKGGIIDFHLSGTPTEVKFCLSDSGIGIPQAEQDKVFESFYRASNANLIYGTPGTGLGLTIVKWIAEKHGGTIAINSEEKQGTKILVSLPLKN